MASSAFKVGDGYRVILPVATFLTWQGRNLEGAGVAPDISEPLDALALMQGHDIQLSRAVEATDDVTACRLTVTNHQGHATHTASGPTVHVERQIASQRDLFRHSIGTTEDFAEA